MRAQYLASPSGILRRGRECLFALPRRIAESCAKKKTGQISRNCGQEKRMMGINIGCAEHTRKPPAHSCMNSLSCGNITSLEMVRAKRMNVLCCSSKTNILAMSKDGLGDSRSLCMAPDEKAFFFPRRQCSLPPSSRLP